MIYVRQGYDVGFTRDVKRGAEVRWGRGGRGRERGGGLGREGVGVGMGT